MRKDGSRGIISESWDLASIILISTVLAIIIYFLPDNPLRVALGIPFILFFPGYALLSTLFPERSSLELIERIALSFGLSIALVPLIGFILNYTFSITLDPILWSLIAFDLVMCYAAFYRREKALDPYLPFPISSVRGKISSQFRGQGRLDRYLTTILVVSIAASLVTLVYIVAFPSQGEKFSEFYILGPDGKATGYPHNLTKGETGNLIIGISNHEYRTVNYVVEVWLANITSTNTVTTVNTLIYMDNFSVPLDHVEASLDGNWTEQWQMPYAFNANYDGVDTNTGYKIFFLLFKDTEPFPMAEGVDYASDPYVVQRFVVDSSSSNTDVLSTNLNLFII